MTLRTGHGNGAGVPRVEVLPADELPPPIPATSEVKPELAGRVKRHGDGRFVDSASAKAVGSLGGRRKAENARLVSALGLAKLAEDCEFVPYRRAGDEFTREHLAKLAEQSGGEVGPGPSSIVASAGLQLAASRFLADRGAKAGDAKLLLSASSLANDSRQNLLAAYELAVREAKARRQATPPTMPWLEASNGGANEEG